MLTLRSYQTVRTTGRVKFSRVKLTMAMLCAFLLQNDLAIAAEQQITAQTQQTQSAGQQGFSQNAARQMNLTKPVQEVPKIQLAILLDTSGSMDGLIDQTRNQLWQVVNEFSMTKKNGVTPVLEVALFEYGNDGNPQEDGYVRKLNNFTRELDKVSEGLFSLTTNGGSEYCGMAIKTAIDGLQWSQSSDSIKTIFIAGNEPFTQGPVDFRQALKRALKQGIVVNTIHAGDHDEGIQGGWQSGALLAGGDYMSINANQKVVHIVAPQDKEIAALNAQLNDTYVPYGASGKVSAQRQQKQDSLSSHISPGLLAKRAKSKSTSFYNNVEWDLVDAMNQGKVDKEILAEMEETVLPADMKGMTVKEKQEYVKAKSAQRQKIKQKISSLSDARSAYVMEHKRKQVAAAPDMSEALVKAIKKQIQKKEFTYEKEQPGNQ